MCCHLKSYGKISPIARGERAGRKYVVIGRDWINDRVNRDRCSDDFRGENSTNRRGKKKRTRNRPAISRRRNDRSKKATQKSSQTTAKTPEQIPERDETIQELIQFVRSCRTHLRRTLAVCH